MDKQELINILKSQSETFSEDVKRKLEYLNSDEVFSEYTQDLDEGLDDEFEDEIDDDVDDDDDDEDDDEDEDEDEDDDEEEEDDDDDDDDKETESVDSETLKKQKLAAKIAAMRGLSAPQFLKK